MTHVSKFLLVATAFFSMHITQAGSSTPSTQGPVTLTTQPVDETTVALTIKIQVPPNAHLYRDYLTLSVDNPEVTIGSWTSDQEPRSAYDATFKNTKKIFEHDTTLTLQAQRKQASRTPARLHVSYYLSTNKAIEHVSFPLLFSADTASTPNPEDLRTVTDNNDLSTIPAGPSHQQKESKPTRSYSEYISSLITRSNTLWVRLLLVLLLGVLMSLTPCIYPMIPITVGILQAQGSRSLMNNMLVSLAYTTGIATTFALLGLAAATTGQMFGAFMANPFIILFIVLLLAYLGGAMFGFYEMYVPSFLKQRETSTTHGSLTSAFLFGAASGTVASPCLSPGLVLLLSIVTTLKSKFMGFLLLFMFGVGLSLPLLIIGTFSSSLALLPRAGVWMIAVKKLFGFMLFGMCFYFLKPLVPAPYLLSMLALFLCTAGLFYLYHESKKASGVWRSPYGLLGMLFIVAACVVATQAYKAYLMTQQCVECSHWETNYAQALAKAKSCNKKLFVDIGASFCSICTAIDKKVLANKMVDAALAHFCCVKINGADDPDNVIKLLQDKYGVVGFPTFLLIEPRSQVLIKRWGSELYDVDAQAFAYELEQLSGE